MGNLRTVILEFSHIYHPRKKLFGGDDWWAPPRLYVYARCINLEEKTTGKNIQLVRLQEKMLLQSAAAAATEGFGRGKTTIAAAAMAFFQQPNSLKY